MRAASGNAAPGEAGVPGEPALQGEPDVDRARPLVGFELIVQGRPRRQPSLRSERPRPPARTRTGLEEQQ